MIFIVSKNDCQTINIDSLLKITNANLSENKLTAERFEAIASYYWRVNPDSALLFTNKLKELGDKLNNKDIISNANLIYGSLKLDKNEMVEARKFYDLALKDQKDKSKILKLYSNYGSTYINSNDFNNAENWLNKALSLAQELKDKKAEAFIINNFGIINDDKGNKELAIKQYLHAGKLFESIGEIGRLGVMYHNIGAVYSNLKVQHKAIEFTHKAIECYQSVKNFKSMNNANLNLLYYYNEVDSTQKAEQIIERINNAVIPLNSSQISLLLLLKGQILEKKGQYKDAIDTLKKCIINAKSANSPINIHNGNATLIRIYNKTEEFAKGIPHGEEALKIAFEMGDAISINLDQELLAKAYSGVGNFKQAFYYLNEFEKGRDTIYNKEKFEAIHSIETKYETEKKDMLLVQHQADLSNKKKQIWFLVTLLGLSVGLVVLYRKRNHEKAQVASLLSSQNLVLQSNNQNLIDELQQIKTKKSSKPIEDLFVTLTGNGKEVVKLTDITYIMADGNSVEIFTKDNKKYYDWQKIKHYRELLEPSGLFLQTHRSYLINYQYITAKKANELRLNHSVTIPIGNTMKEGVHEWLKAKLG